MNNYQTMSLNDLITLRNDLQAEATYCRSVNSPGDATDTEAELEQIADELNARRALLTPATTLRAGMSA